MPRYFFNSIDSEQFPDRDGTELPGADAAHREAVRFLGALVNDRPSLVQGSRYYGVEVMNSDREVLFTTVTLTIEGSRSLPIGDVSASPKAMAEHLLADDIAADDPHKVEKLATLGRNEDPDAGSE